MRTKLINTTFDLIKLQTEPSNLLAKEEIIKYIKDQFKNQPVFIKEFVSNNEPSILITFEDTLNPQILLYSHLDVVPAPITEYNPQIKDNKLYGRGAGDMKSAAAVILELFKSYLDQPDKPSIGLMFTCDEEVGGFNGTKYMLEQGLNCELCIMPDSSMGTDTIITNQKGIGMVKIWAYGKTAHGSRPHLGSNAIEKVTSDLVKIRKLFKKTQKANTPTTINIGTIQGGEQTNQVPEYAEATIDIRYQESAKFYKLFNKIKKICNENAQVEMTGYPYHCHLKNPQIQSYIKTFQDLFQKPIQFQTESGGSDARFFAEKNIPVIVTGIEKANSHSINENCSIDDMENFYNLLEKFIQDHVDVLK
jgi:succinyl-diaminopimelate desuccinylase